MDIALSILSIKDKLDINKLNNTNCGYIHLDIMDGKFVTNKTWNYEDIKDFSTNKPLDVHLMVEDVNKYIEDFSKMNPLYITFHYEATDKVIETINLIKSKGIKAGISIKPNTSVDSIKEYLKYVDLVLVMSVEPGMGGQKYLDEATNKINYLKEIQKEYNYVIEVDGGINETTIQNAHNADIKVVGSFITNYEDYNNQIDKLEVR